VACGVVWQERDALAKALEGLKKQASDRALVDDQRARTLEDDLREARARADDKVPAPRPPCRPKGLATHTYS